MAAECPTGRRGSSFGATGGIGQVTRRGCPPAAAFELPPAFIAVVSCHMGAVLSQVRIETTREKHPKLASCEEKRE